MDDIIAKYRDLSLVLEEEFELTSTVLDGETFQKYRQILSNEIESVQENLHHFYKYLFY